MLLLTTGVLTWFSVHIILMDARNLRTRIVKNIGKDPCKEIFSLTILSSMVSFDVRWLKPAPTSS